MTFSSDGRLVCSVMDWQKQLILLQGHVLARILFLFHLNYKYGLSWKYIKTKDINQYLKLLSSVLLPHFKLEQTLTSSPGKALQVLRTICTVTSLLYIPLHPLLLLEETARFFLIQLLASKPGFKVYSCLHLWIQRKFPKTLQDLKIHHQLSLNNLLLQRGFGKRLFLYLTGLKTASLINGLVHTFRLNSMHD